MRTLTFALLVLSISATKGLTVTYVKPVNSQNTGFPYDDAETNISDAVYGNNNTGEIRILPGVYWESVNINLQSSNTNSQLITGWIPGDNPTPENPGHIAGGGDAELIRIRSANYNHEFTYEGIDHFRWNGFDGTEQNFHNCAIFTDTHAWTRLGDPSDPTPTSYYINLVPFYIDLFFDPSLTDSTEIAFVPDGGIHDYVFEIQDDNTDAGHTITISNVTLQFGCYGATAMRLTESDGATFENVRFYDSYQCEFRFTRADVNNLTFSNCQFKKHSSDIVLSTPSHITFDQQLNLQPYSDYITGIQFIDCEFGIPEDSEDDSVFGFYKGDNGNLNRKYVIDGISFTGCRFIGPYKAAISLRQDWTVDDSIGIPGLRIQNVTINNCEFLHNKNAMVFYPPIKYVHLADNQILECENGVIFHPYLMTGGTFHPEEENAIANGLFTDNILIDGNNTFDGIGIYNANALANRMHELTNNYLAGYTGPETMPQNIVELTQGFVLNSPAFGTPILSQGRALGISGRMTDLVIDGNTFKDIQRSAIVLKNSNHDIPLYRQAIRVTNNEASECLGTAYALASSWMTVSGNGTRNLGTTNVLFNEVDNFFDDLSDSLNALRQAHDIPRAAPIEMTVAIGISITPAVTWEDTHVRDIDVTNNDLLGCTAQGILTEGVYKDPTYLRVDGVNISENRIHTTPYVYVGSDYRETGEDVWSWVTGHKAQHWPTMWISDSDNCSITGNYALCEQRTCWPGEPDVQTAGIGITIDGCDNVMVENNHFRGLSEAFRLRVDNQNGTIASPNRPINRFCTVRNNVFSRIFRDSSMGEFLASHQGKPLLSMGYQSQFTHMPLSQSPEFHDNVVADNYFQFDTLSEYVDGVTEPCLMLNFPLAGWPGTDEDHGFFMGLNHSCAGIATDPNEVGQNFLTDNWFNFLTPANGAQLDHVSMQRYDHFGGLNDCVARDNHLYRFSLDQYGTSEILTDNHWDCTFEEIGEIVVPELGNFPTFVPILHVPEEFTSLQSAIDFVATHTEAAYIIEVSSATLTGPGNLDLDIPTGHFVIRSQGTTVLDAEDQSSWLSLEPGAELTVSGFHFQNANPTASAISATNASLTLENCILETATESVLVNTICTLVGTSSWLDLACTFEGTAHLSSIAAMDWHDVTLHGPVVPDAQAPALLAVDTDAVVTLDQLVVSGSANDGVLLKGAIATLDVCHISLCAGIGLALQGGQTSLNNCQINNCEGAGLQATLGAELWDTGGIYQANQNGMECIGSTVSVKLVDTSMDHNLMSGFVASSCDLVRLSNTQLVDNQDCGAFLQNVDARFIRCMISGNANRGIKADHSRVDMSDYAANVVSDNATGQLTFDYAEPVFHCGHNSITGAIPCLISGVSSTSNPMDFQYNYWGQSDPMERICLLPPTWQLFPVCETPCLTGSECIPITTPRELLQEAAEQELLLQWLTARDTYQTIPEPWPTSEEALSALHGVYRCSLEGKLDQMAAHDYFLYIAERFPETDLAKLAIDLATRSKGASGQRMAAAGDFLSLVPVAPQDSLANLQKAVVMATEAALLGEVDKSGGTDALSGLPAFTDMDQVAAWLRGDLPVSAEGSGAQAALPQSFSLSHPWPNPFNPETRFSMELPEPARLTLTVHNILGQRVLRMVEDQVPAGRHTRAWSGVNDEGRAVASGVYLLSVEASAESGRQWNRTEKLLLVR